MTKFQAWLEKFGRANLARALGVTWAAVHPWYSGKGKPRPELANRIVALSEGELTLEDIYAPTSTTTETKNG